jgi:FkbM family methyltransferase
LLQNISVKKVIFFSFEASPKVYKLLCKNCSLSNKNISHFNLAIADKEGKSKFNLPQNPQEQGSGSLSTNNMGDIEVKSISIDRFVQTENITRLDFIKMDIEGAEVKALSGMKETISKYKPKMLFEFSPSRYKVLEITQFESLVKFMKNLRYKFKFLTRNGEWKYIKSFPNTGIWTIYAEIDSDSL